MQKCMKIKSVLLRNELKSTQALMKSKLEAKCAIEKQMMSENDTLIDKNKSLTEENIKNAE